MDSESLPMRLFHVALVPFAERRIIIMKKRFLAWVLALILLTGMGTTALAAGDKPILALGANLSEDQKRKI